MKLAVFIPARLQSQRLNNKLILPIGDTSLFREACKKLKIIDKQYDTYALCSEKELVEIAKQEKVKIIARDPKTCLVDNPLKYIFKDLKQINATHLMFLNPCLFYLKTSTIINALQIFEEESMDYATSVKPLKNWLFDFYGNHLNEMNYRHLNTKEIDPVFQTAHCFHIFNKHKFFEDGMMLKKGLGILPIINEKELIDVDTEEDYSYIAFLEDKGRVTT